MTIVTVADCTGANISSAPKGVQLAGYVTGTGGVPWTAADWAKYPGAVRIDQSPVNTPADETADVYDLEARAGNLAGLPTWARNARENRTKGVRVGQRWPAVYAAMSNVTPVANTLLAANIVTGVFLWIADWGVATAVAQAAILDAGGRWPVIGWQLANMGSYDLSLFSAAWLGNVTGAAKPAPKPVTKAAATAALATVEAYVTQG